MMPRFTCDRETDILYIRFDPGAEHGNSETHESDNLFVVFDLDPDGRAYGMEVLDASRRMNLEALGVLAPSGA
jgi:uncharacterized protein YuzE